jgi:sugar lactone lactonase YvrE
MITKSLIEGDQFIVMSISKLVLHRFIFVILGLLYNQPKICPFATWNPNAITFASIDTVGSNPIGIFIDSNNTVYVPNRDNSQIYTWTNNNINATKIISGNFLHPQTIFATVNGDIYIDNGLVNDRVDKWSSNTNTWTPVMYINARCYDLFVDINNTIYCSMYDRHQVVKHWLNDNARTSTIVAGTGTPDSTSNTLLNPEGIFVDTNFDLYVADCRNDRIQLFQLGQLNATTVAEAGSPNITFILSCPIGIVLDADKYLFIVEWDSHRIVRSGPANFRCIVGCSSISYSSPDQLANPRTLNFDSFGNIFVADFSNHRIQKFILEDNFCGKFFSQEK